MSAPRFAVTAFVGGLVAYAMIPTVHAQPSADDPVIDAGVDAPPADAPVEPPPVDAPAQPQPKLSQADLDLLKQAEAAAGEIIEINDEAPAESASSVHLDQRDLQFRSRTQVSDILRQVPGLMVSQ